MKQLVEGILLIDKNEGETSYDVVNKIKSVFNKGKTIKVGHAGTLDPFASGLLIILLGQGTKLSPFVMSEKKVYLATMSLGVETDTLDPTGRVIRTSAVCDLQPDIIEEKARYFIGDIKQSPPMYSAVKYKGTRAYRLARKGIEVDLQMRTVTIDSLQIISVDLPEITMEVKCSSGTYIRSLGADFGRELGPGAHIKYLRRLACGSFDVKNAINSNELLAEDALSVLWDSIINLRDAIPGIREIEVDSILADKVRHGYQPALKDLCGDSEGRGYENAYVKLIDNERLLAIGELNTQKIKDKGKLIIKKVFY